VETRRRPRVICHMVAAIDGRVSTRGWPMMAEASRQYELVHASYEAEGWMCGRVTMEPYAKHVRSDEEVSRERTGTAPREDFVAPGEHESYAFAIDARGRLAWESSDISGDHVVAILSERVSDDYLDFLRQRGVSYMFAGARDVDLSLALEKIVATFHVRTLLLEGGGRINGGMMAAGLIDEVSLLVAPVADGRMGTPALFDAEGTNVQPRRLVLEHVDRRDDDVLWLRYRVERSADQSPRSTAG